MSLTTPEVQMGDFGKALMIPDGARVLIVCENDSEAAQVQWSLPEGQFVTERARSISEGCEAAKSGRFQVIVAAPLLSDGSWRRLSDIAYHYNLGFEIILWARNLGPFESARALNDGAFDILDAMYEQGRAVEATKRAIWAAYLKGAGPRPSGFRPRKVA